MLDVTECNKET